MKATTEINTGKYTTTKFPRIGTSSAALIAVA